MKIPTPYNRFLYLFYFIENLYRSTMVKLYVLRGHTVLIDHFPGTNRNVVHKGLLGQINQLMFKLTPKPNLFVFISVAPNLIFKRKQELNIKQIQNIQNGVLEMLKGEKHEKITNNCLEDALNKALTQIASL